METCSACGARLAPEAEWCNQCYTRVGAARPAPAGVPPLAPVTPPSVGRLGWAPPPPPEVPVFSRMKAGPTSFGVGGRTLLTIGVLILDVLGYFALLGNIGLPPDAKSAIAYFALSPLVVIPVLMRVWRRSRIR
ncbi:MAG TPA: hypothetical protein VGH10_03820 [Actinomycetota bacterium]|jgi:hypothetical protein